jgi:peptide deformylase
VTLRPLRLLGDPVLTASCAPVTAFDGTLRRLVDDLMETVDQPGRAGLAAPQIGVGLRVFSYLVDRAHGYVVNPEVVETSDEQIEEDEGCLSVPGLWFPVGRAAHVVVSGVDVRNRPVTVEGSGVLARCLLHETDHLDGVVYLDRLGPQRRKDALRAVRSSDWFWADRPQGGLLR